MHQLRATNDYEVWLSQIARPFCFSTPFDGRDFVLLLNVADPTVTEEEREAVSQEIIRQGCRYAVCAGDQCSMWDTSIDLAYLATDPDFSPPDDRSCMTTWHEDEPLEDVVEFFRRVTYDDSLPERFFVLILGGDARVGNQLRRYVENAFEPQ